MAAGWLHLAACCRAGRKASSCQNATVPGTQPWWCGWVCAQHHAASARLLRQNCTDITALLPQQGVPPSPPRLSTRCQPVSPRAAGQGLVPSSKGRNGTGATGCFRALCPCLVCIFPPHQLREQLSLCPGQGCVCSPGVHHQQRARSRLCFPEAGCRRGARQLSCPPHAARQPTSCCVCRRGGRTGTPEPPPSCSAQLGTPGQPQRMSA